LFILEQEKARIDNIYPMISPFLHAGMEHQHSTHSKRWGCLTNQPTYLLLGTW